MSTYRDGAVVRRERMMKILEMIKKEPGIMIKDIQAKASWHIGLSNKTTEKYVQELIVIGLVAVDNEGFKATGRQI